MKPEKSGARAEKTLTPVESVSKPHSIPGSFMDSPGNGNFLFRKKMSCRYFSFHVQTFLKKMGGLPEKSWLSIENDSFQNVWKTPLPTPLFSLYVHLQCIIYIMVLHTLLVTNISNLWKRKASHLPSYYLKGGICDSSLGGKGFCWKFSITTTGTYQGNNGGYPPGC